MRTVWKYTFEPRSSFELMMPKGAEIKSIERQHGTFCMWVAVDPAVGKEYRFFRIFGTGDEISDKEFQALDFLQTLQMDSGNTVLHLFELKV